ncbi:unnamed protein product [Spodoptera exigua]|nr:unnamed protein product [Spodoptera exigua]
MFKTCMVHEDNALLTVLSMTCGTFKVVVKRKRKSTIENSAIECAVHEQFMSQPHRSEVGKRAFRLSDGKQSSPPMDTSNNGRSAILLMSLTTGHPMLWFQ